MAIASASAASSVSNVALRHQHPHHHVDLLLVAMADADHRLLDRVGRIFGDCQSGQRRNQHGDAARLAELQRRGGILVDEGLLDGGLVRRLVASCTAARPSCSWQSRAASAALSSERTVPAADEAQHVAVDVDHAPAGAAKPRIDADDANRLAACANPSGSRNDCQTNVNETETERGISRARRPCSGG